MAKRLGDRDGLISALHQYVLVCGALPVGQEILDAVRAAEEWLSGRDGSSPQPVARAVLASCRADRKSVV